MFDPDLPEFFPIAGCLLGSSRKGCRPGDRRGRQARGSRPGKRLPEPPGLQTGRSLATSLGRDPAAEAQGWALGRPLAQRASQESPVIPASRQQSCLPPCELPAPMAISKPKVWPSPGDAATTKATSGPFFSLGVPPQLKRLNSPAQPMWQG